MIVSDPQVMMGKPVVAGTRITVEHILEDLARGTTVEQLIDAHPRLTREGISAALLFAAEALRAARRSTCIVGLNPRTAGDATLQETSMAMEELKNAFWLAVTDSLVQFHGFSFIDAKARAFELRSKIENVLFLGCMPDLIYHDEPFYIASSLAGHELELQQHMAEYQAILERRFS